MNVDDTPENPENPENRLQDKADPVCAVSAGRVRYTLAGLLAETETSGRYPSPPEEREWMDAPAVGRELLLEDLQTVEAITSFLAHAEASGDMDYIKHVRKIAAQARVMHGLEG